MADNRTYAAAHFALEFDQNTQKFAGFFHAIEGGGIKAEVISYREGHDQWRQLSKPKYEDIKLQVGMAMSSAFYEWISAFFRGKVVRKSGAILAADFRYVERARREMAEMLISEVSLPALDGDNNTACNMTVTIAPERVRFAPGSNKKLSAANTDKQKLWTPNNFALRIDGFDEACRRVTKIDGFTIKQNILDYPAGNMRDSLRVPGQLEFPNLTFHMPEADAGPFLDHFTKHVIKGTKQAPTRQTGAIEYQDHDGAALCRVDLFGVDVAKITPDKSEAGSDSFKQITVEISVERMKFSHFKS